MDEKDYNIANNVVMKAKDSFCLLYTSDAADEG